MHEKGGDARQALDLSRGAQSRQGAIREQASTILRPACERREEDGQALCETRSSLRIRRKVAAKQSRDNRRSGFKRAFTATKDDFAERLRGDGADAFLRLHRRGGLGGIHVFNIYVFQIIRVRFEHKWFSFFIEALHECNLERKTRVECGFSDVFILRIDEDAIFVQRRGTMKKRCVAERASRHASNGRGIGT